MEKYTASTGLLLFVLLFTGATAVNLTVSNACHGNPGLQETSNYVFCAPEFEICIREVEFYEHIPTGSCPDSEIVAPSPGCCDVQDQQCFWKGNVTEVQELHDECNSTRTIYGQCLIPTGPSKPPPMGSNCTRQSSIRSVLFFCINGTCPDIVPETTTPPSTTEYITTEMTTEISTSTSESTTDSTLPAVTEEQQTPPDDTAAIIGGSIAGAVALICLILVAVFTCRKSRSRKYHQEVISGIPEAKTQGTYNETMSTADEKTHM